jgi:hypothetical protein
MQTTETEKNAYMAQSLRKLEIMHVQKIKAPAEGGNAQGGDYREPRELWLLINGAIRGTVSKPELLRLPTIVVARTTWEAYHKVLERHTPKDLGPEKARPTHCQCISSREGTGHIWLIYAADPALGRSRSYTLAIMEEKDLDQTEWLPLVQRATRAEIVDIREGALPEDMGDLTVLPMLRVGISEYLSWLIFKDLCIENSLGLSLGKPGPLVAKPTAKSRNGSSDTILAGAR